jgi:hypothetical protein
MNAVAQTVNLAVLCLRTDVPPCIYTCGGQRFICAFVRDRRVLHDAFPSTASLRRLFETSNVDGGLVLVSDASQGLGLLQCRVWATSAVEEWPLNVLGFSAALAYVCDGCDDVLEAVIAGTPSASEIMPSLQPFDGVELKDNPTILSCVIESGFCRGSVLKPRPSFAKVSQPLRVLI